MPPTFIGIILLQEVLQKLTVTSECNRHPVHKYLIHDSIHLRKIIHIGLKIRATCQYGRLPKKTAGVKTVQIMR